MVHLASLCIIRHGTWMHAIILIRKSMSRVALMVTCHRAIGWMSPLLQHNMAGSVYLPCRIGAHFIEGHASPNLHFPAAWIGTQPCSNCTPPMYSSHPPECCHRH